MTPEREKYCYFISDEEIAVRKQIIDLKSYIKIKKLLLTHFPNNERAVKRKKDIAKIKNKIKELKKHLPMKVLYICDEFDNGSPYGVRIYGNCPCCKSYVFEEDECSKCGQALKWE